MMQYVLMAKTKDIDPNTKTMAEERAMFMAENIDLRCVIVVLWNSTPS